MAATHVSYIRLVYKCYVNVAENGSLHELREIGHCEKRKPASSQTANTSLGEGKVLDKHYLHYLNENVWYNAYCFLATPKETIHYDLPVWLPLFIHGFRPSCSKKKYYDDAATPHHPNHTTTHLPACLHLVASVGVGGRRNRESKHLEIISKWFEDEIQARGAYVTGY